MTTENLQMTITAVDHASAVVDRLMSKMKQLTSMASKISANPTKGMGSLDTGKAIRDNFTKSQNDAMRGLRQRLNFENRMTSQRIAGERAVASEQNRTSRIVEGDAMRLFRIRMRATSDVMRMSGVAEREAERTRARTVAADERNHSSAIRRQIAGHRYLFGLRERMDREERRNTEQASKSKDRLRAAARRSFGSAGTHARDAGRGIMDTARTVTVYSGIAGGIVGKIAQTGLSARSRADTAEANLRMFGGQTRQQVNDARTGWINGAAVANGFRPADAINAFTETLKAGVPASAAPDVTKSIMGASAGLDLNVAETTKLVGRLSTLTQDPKAFSAGAIDKMLNGIAVVAKVTAADSKELVSSLRRGAGVLGSSKMSVTDLTAFTGTGISAGLQEGKAGTFMDFLVNDLVNAKNSRGQRRKDLVSGLSLAGVGGVEQVSRQAANDPTQLLLKLFGNMSKMDPAKAGRVASLVGMREWRGEILQMMKAFPMLKQTVEAGRDPANAGHLAQARNERLGTLAGLGSQLRATADLAWEAIGGGIEDIVRDIGRFFINFGGKLNLDVIKAHVASLLNGFVDGLGFANVTEMMDRIFGSPDFSTVNSFFRFAQGFGQGVREVIDTVRSAFSMFAGKDADAETIGKLTAKLFGFSMAMVAVGGVLGPLGSLAAIIGGLAFAIGGIAKGATGLGLFGGAGAAGGAGIAGGGLATAGGLLGVGALAAIANKFNILKAPDVSKGWGRGIAEFLDPGLASRIFGDDKAKPDEKGSTKPRAWSDPPSKKTVGPKSIPEQIRDKLPIERTAYAGPSGDLTEAMDRLRQSVDRLAAGWQGVGSKLKLDAIMKPARTTKASFSTGTTGSEGSTVPSVTKGFFNPERMTVPGWYGKGSGGGSGSGSKGSGPGSATSGLGGAIAPFRGSQTFNALVPRISADLQKDFPGLSKLDTSAILGNLGHESAGMTAFQEGKPMIPGSRGGWGWAQWTGPRRRAFEAYAANHGLDPKSYEANYGFLRHELGGKYARSLGVLKGQNTLEGKTIAFEKSFEAAGIKHYPSRLKYANRAMGLPDGVAGVGGPGEAASRSVDRIVESAKRANAVSIGADGMRSTGWQPGAGTANRSAITGVPDAEQAIGNVPMPPRRPAGVGAGGAGGGGDIHIHQTINGGQNTPQEIANLSQRQITKDWNHRSHDVEFDMA